MSKRKVEEKILDVNAAMQGSLVFSDPVNLRINGKFSGSLTTKGILTVGESADIKADIVGENIIINGSVKGNVRATESIKITSTAQVNGDINVPRISIEDGAIFNGKCKIVNGKISLEELANYLSIEENKIKEWVNSGKIPVDKDGDKLMFDRKEVDNWVAHKP